MSKKKKWWFGDSDDNDSSVLFPNTVKQHEKKQQLGAPVYQNGRLVSGSDGVIDWDDSAFENADYYGWGRKSYRKEIKPTDELSGELQNILGDTKTVTNSRSKKLYASQGRLEFAQDWEESWNTGHWQGYSYYRTPTLTYRYVQQMANALASQHKIEVRVGNNWDCDLKTRTLTYNPASLVYSTKSELLATLLHEIGKLRYSTGLHELLYAIYANPPGLSRFLDAYGVNAYTAMLPFEELRIDTKMLSEYGSAGEIYESQEPALQAIYKNYKKLSFNMREITITSAMAQFKLMLTDVQNNGNQVSPDFARTVRIMHYVDQGFSQDMAVKKVRDEEKSASSSIAEQVNLKMRALFGVETREEAMEEFKKMARIINDKDTLFDYVAAAYSSAYILNHEGESTPGIAARIAKTNPSFKLATVKSTTAEVVCEMDKNVFPVIEDLLKEAKNGFSELEKFGEDFKTKVWDSVTNTMRQQNNATADSSGSGQVDADGKQRVRMPASSSGKTNQTTVPEWFDGDYGVLKDSVRSEISRLSRMLNFLRRTEQTIRWTENQRRGRLDAKKLYRARLGSRRVFRSRLENTDTIRSFAFSILLDVSGSMAGSRLANTTRGMVILTEVFKEMNIPFEIITFSDGAKILKSFDDSVDRKVENSIGGLPKHNGGGTNLNNGLEKMNLSARHERNKVCIVLTDGGVSNVDYYNESHFRPMLQKEHIQSLAFGLEIRQDEISKLCNNTGRAIKNAVEVPYVFADMLKSLILKK